MRNPPTETPKPLELLKFSLLRKKYNNIKMAKNEKPILIMFLFLLV
jgi:hypothetical protein